MRDLTNKTIADSRGLLVMLAVSLTLTSMLVACGDGGSSSSSGNAYAGEADNKTDADFEMPADTDGDNILNSDDVDDDGDGLIEIRSAAELDMIRNNLAGTGFSDTFGGLGSAQGCNGVSYLDDLSSVTDVCLGYELETDISLSNYSNWRPIGACSGTTILGTADTPSNIVCSEDSSFTAIFEGNNHTISDLNIIMTGADKYGVGLFGTIASGAVLRNVHLQNVAINRQSATEGWFVGSVVGVAQNGTIHSISTDGGSVVGSGYVGGLIGLADGGTLIEKSSASLSMVEGRYKNVGGLVGHASDCVIESSFASINSVSSTEDSGGIAGGLAGGLINCDVRNVHSEMTGIFSKNQYVGGLVGVSDNSTISAAAALSGTIVTEASFAGGLAGMAIDSRIATSLSVSGEIIGLNSVSGFAGIVAGNSSIDSSYAMRLTFSGAAPSGFITTASDADITLRNSYYVSTNEDKLWMGDSIPQVYDSYWDSNYSAAATNANARTSEQLQVGLSSSGDFSGDFMHWGEGWCNPATGEFTRVRDIAESGGYDDNPAWNLGDDTQYPTTRCIEDFPYGLQLELMELFFGQI